MIGDQIFAFTVDYKESHLKTQTLSLDAAWIQNDIARLFLTLLKLPPSSLNIIKYQNFKFHSTRSVKTLYISILSCFKLLNKFNSFIIIELYYKTWSNE